jgi:hypothetical protein
MDGDDFARMRWRVERYKRTGENIKSIKYVLDVGDLLAEVDRLRAENDAILVSLKRCVDPHEWYKAAYTAHIIHGGVAAHSEVYRCANTVDTPPEVPWFGEPIRFELPERNETLDALMAKMTDKVRQACYGEPIIGSAWRTFVSKDTTVPDAVPAEVIHFASDGGLVPVCHKFMTLKAGDTFQVTKDLRLITCWRCVRMAANMPVPIEGPDGATTFINPSTPVAPGESLAVGSEQEEDEPRAADATPLEPTTPCVCLTVDLMRYGCRCGAMGGVK